MAVGGCIVGIPSCSCNPPNIAFSHQFQRDFSSLGAHPSPFIHHHPLSLSPILRVVANSILLPIPPFFSYTLPVFPQPPPLVTDQPPKSRIGPSTRPPHNLPTLGARRPRLCSQPNFASCNPRRATVPSFDYHSGSGPALIGQRRQRGFVLPS